MKSIFLAVLAIPLLCLGQAGIITTVAGNGTTGNTGDGGLATNATLGAQVLHVAADNSGTFYITDEGNHRIRKVTPAGIISNVAAAGSGNSVALDALGNLYVGGGGSIRKMTPAGVVTTVAGTQFAGFSGDGGLATAAAIFVQDLAVDGAGNIYFTDVLNGRIRKIDTAGIINTIAGPGTSSALGDGGLATNARLSLPQGISADSAGNVYFADGGNRVRRVGTDGIITTVAGNGSGPALGENVLATSIGVAPGYTALDAAGNLYIAEPSAARIRKVNTAGFLSTIAGGNGPGFSGDGGPATSAKLFNPSGVASDQAGNVYISDVNNNRVRKVSSGTTNTSVLSLGTSTLSYAYTIGGATPASQTVSVVSSGEALPFTTTSSTTSGGSWLSVSASGSSTPATLTVSSVPGILANLAAGTYRGTITVTPSGASTTAQSVTVTLTVSGGGGGAITINAPVNASGYQTKLAPDTVFVIFGSGMGPASIVIANAPSYPSSLGGTSVSFTPAAGGAPIPANMVYTLAGQIAGLLPSSITPGTYAVRVSYNGQTSAAQNVTVVARSMGIATANSSGAGTVQATIGNVNGGVSLTRFTTGSVSFNGLNWTLTPAHPGDALVLWGTGGGADAANDSGGTSGDQTAAGNFVVNVGGRQITPLYAGASSGYPGLWQINFNLPPDIAADCFAPLQVSAGGELSNAITLPIAATGQTACSDPYLNSTVLSKLDSGADLTVGALAISRIRDTPTNTSVEIAGGFIGRYKAAKFALNYSGPRFGSCFIYDRTYPVGGTDPASPEAFLDAGARLPISGPNLGATAALASNSANPLGPIYALSPAAGTWAAGTYTLTASGGRQVGPFTASTPFASSFTATNFDAIPSIVRTTPLTISWTGTGFAQVYIIVSTSTRTGSSQHVVTINCPVPASPGTYTIPATALAYLQPAAVTGTSFGSIAVEAHTESPFTAPLIGGGQTDVALFTSDLGVSKNIAVQ